MRPEFLPLSPDDAEIAAYRDALLKVGVGVETTADALENACKHVTSESACILSDVIAAYPQAVNMIVHGGFEDARGRTLLVLPRDHTAFKIVRDALADSHTSIPGFAPKYVEASLIQALEETAERLGMPLGPRSTLSLPGWYTIFPSSGDDAQGRRREPRPTFDKTGKVVEEVSDGGGHISSRVSKDAEHAAIDIPDPASIGLPGPCFLTAYLTGKTSTAEIKPGLARVDCDRCCLEPLPHKHHWKPFWAYVPDYSEARQCALLTGERCTAKIEFAPSGQSRRGKQKKESGGSCGATRKVKASRVSKAVLLPQPPADWRHYPGLEPQKGHVHLWHKQEVRWAGASIFRLESFYCPLCDAEVWPVEVHPDPMAYMNYGPAVDKIAKSLRFPKEVRTAFAEDEGQRGAYVAPGAWNKPEGIQREFKDLTAKVEKELSKEIKAFKAEVEKLGDKQRRKAPLSVFLEISERVADAHKRRWKPPAWVVDVEIETGDDETSEAEEDAEDES